MSENSTQTQNENTAENQTEVSLDIQDLAVALRAVDQGIEKGAFEPKEISVIGETRNNLDVFLQATQKLKENEGNTESEGSGSDETPETNPSLSLSDISVALYAMDIGIKRGVFEPKSVAEIGKTRNKFEYFIASAKASFEQSEKDKEEGNSSEDTSSEDKE